MKKKNLEVHVPVHHLSIQVIAMKKHVVHGVM
jgi:hypothetical protein